MGDGADERRAGQSKKSGVSHSQTSRRFPGFPAYFGDLHQKNLNVCRLRVTTCRWSGNQQLGCGGGGGLGKGILAARDSTKSRVVPGVREEVSG